MSSAGLFIDNFLNTEQWTCVHSSHLTKLYVSVNITIIALKSNWKDNLYLLITTHLCIYSKEFYWSWFIFIFKHLKYLIKIWYTERRNYDLREEFEEFSQTELIGVMIIQIFSFILKSSLMTCCGHFSISTTGPWNHWLIFISILLPIEKFQL